MSDLAGDIRRAYANRDLFVQDPDLETYRIFHGYTEGLPGLEIDAYGPTAVITSRGAGSTCFAPAKEALEKLGFTSILAKEHGQEPVALLGSLPTQAQVVVEDGLRYNIEAWANTNPGLYLDARPARRWLSKHSQGRHLLNLFSFAGSLGVAAKAGGAASVTHVDSQKRALRRCQKNHAINQQVVDDRDLVCDDVMQFLKNALRGKRRYTGIIVDAPPEPKRRLSSLAEVPALQPGALAEKLTALLAPGGWVLAFFHHDERSWDELEAEFISAAGCELEVTWRGQSGTDFPESDPTRTLRLSTFLR